MARPHIRPTVASGAKTLQHGGWPCRYQVCSCAERTHGHEAVVEGVDLHEVGLQQVLHGLDALLAVLLLRRLLSRVLGAPALLHSLAFSQPVSRRGPISSWPEACFSPISDPCPRYIEVPIPPCRTAWHPISSQSEANSSLFAAPTLAALKPCSCPTAHPSTRATVTLKPALGLLRILALAALYISFNNVRSVQQRLMLRAKTESSSKCAAGSQPGGCCTGGWGLLTGCCHGC